MLKLNLGCGSNFKNDFLNVDKFPQCGPQGSKFLVYDLEEYTGLKSQRHASWPWPSNSCDEVHFIHSLEHMGQTPEAFRHIITELYRVCAHNAKIFIVVPHPRHDDYINDPTHVRPITPEIFALFSKKLNTEWAEKGYSNSQLALAWGVDFEVVEAQGVMDPEVLAQNLTPEQHRDIARALNNGVKEFHITLRVVKEYN